MRSVPNCRTALDVEFVEEILSAEAVFNKPQTFQSLIQQLYELRFDGAITIHFNSGLPMSAERSVVSRTIVLDRYKANR